MTKMSLDINIIRRLAFIKYLFRLGIQQSETPEPLSAAALLTFHDSAELFLQLASEHLNVGGKQPDFMEYWKILNKKLPADTELSQQEAMRRLNKARVSLKHHGILPSKPDIESYRTTTTNFFEENILIIFNVPFNTISMSDFVRPAEARDNLKTAEGLIKEQKLTEALEKIALAFQLMLDDYETRKWNPYHHSPFFFGRDLTFHDSFFIGINRYIDYNTQNKHQRSINQRLGEFVDIVRESLEAMQGAIKILAMGIDYRRYSKFKFLTPELSKLANGDYIYGNRPQHKPTIEEATFCIDFVIESAVRFHEFDYSLTSYFTKESAL